MLKTLFYQPLFQGNKKSQPSYMNKLILVLLTILPMLAYGQTDLSQLEGEWILSDIQSDDSVWVAVNPNAQTPVVGDNGKLKSDYEEKRVSLVEYMQKDLSCGVTRFVFKGNQFEFYRNRELTFKGTYAVKGSKLVLTYENKGGKSTKENTLVLLNREKMVLGSESKEKPVLLSFFRK